MPRSVSTTYPELLHYTKLPALRAILSSGCLWATEVAGLNDRTETTHAFETRIRAVCKDVVTPMVPPDQVEPLTDALIDSYREVTGRVNDYFVTSFCAPPDDYVAKNGLLSMWRSYGEIAIVFDTDRLETMLHDWVGQYRLNRTDLVSVYYEGLPPERQPIAAEDLAELVSHLRDHVDSLIRRTVDPNPSKSYEAITVLSACLKERGFFEELEVRAVVVAPIPGVHDEGSPETRPEAPGVTAGGHRRIQLLFHDPPTLLPIKRVIVAPNYAPEAVRAVLVEHGYADVEVTVSQTPLKPG